MSTPSLLPVWAGRVVKRHLTALSRDTGLSGQSQYHARTFSTTVWRREPAAVAAEAAPPQPEAPQAQQVSSSASDSGVSGELQDAMQSIPTARYSSASALGSFGGRFPQGRSPLYNIRSKLTATYAPDLSSPGQITDILDKAMDVPSRKRRSTYDLEEYAKPRPALKLGPSIGRTVKVNTRAGSDVGRAFRQLDILCNRNKVKSTFLSQRFYERPGLKRKRLKYEGKIRNFKEKFTKVVQMVQGMAKSGW